MTMAEIQTGLSEPFPPEDIGWKPQSVKGNRALAVAYIDARDIENRLDAVLGLGHWQDEYEAITDGSVVCRLRLKIDGEWITKMDVGSPSDQPDGGDRMKAAFSDALKRTAVKFGIGRYLYRLPMSWCDYDPVKKQFVGTPQLPHWAIPKKKAVSANVTPPTPTTAAPSAPTATATVLSKIDVPAILQSLKTCASKEEWVATSKLLARVKDQLTEDEKSTLRPEIARVHGLYGSTDPK